MLHASSTPISEYFVSSHSGLIGKLEKGEDMAAAAIEEDVHTVLTYRQRAYQKTGVTSAAELVAVVLN